MTEARAFLENDLLPEWAAAVASGGSGAAELERVRAMSDAISRVAGDAFYRDAVTAIDRVGASSNRLRLASAHRLYAEAAAAFTADRFDDAEAGFSAARAGIRAFRVAVCTPSHDRARRPRATSVAKAKKASHS